MAIQSKFKILFIFLILLGTTIFASANIDIRLGDKSPFININDVKTFFYDLNLNGDLTVGGVFKLEEAVETDLFFPPTLIKVQGASNIPEQDFWTLNFDDNTMEQAFITFQLPHTRKFGTDLEPHFHWHSELNNTGDVVWCMEYTGANISGIFTPWETDCVVSSSVADSRVHIMSPEIVIANATFTDSAMGKIRIYRNATDTRDTLVGDAQLLQFDVHYYVDRLGQDPIY